MLDDWKSWLEGGFGLFKGGFSLLWGGTSSIFSVVTGGFNKAQSIVGSVL
jgi:hypothetical protein